MNYIQRLERYGFSLEEIQHLITISDKKELGLPRKGQVYSTISTYILPIG